MSDAPNRTLDLSIRKKELLRRLKQQEGLTVSKPALPLQPVNRQKGELFPLSFAQQRLWLLDQLDPGTHVYNIPLVLRLLGKVNTTVFQQAISEVLRRHEALRTAFVAVDGVPYQKVLPPTELCLPITDLSHLGLNERRNKALSLVGEDAQQPFDLTDGTLLRGRFLRMDEDEYILSLCMHHIASDAWSVEIFYKETMALYTSFLEGQPSSLAELPIQYVDYAAWQREWLQGERLEEQISYWKEQLSGLPALLPLPTDHPRPAVQTSHGATTTFRLSPELTNALKALSKRDGVTLFMTLLSAFNVWLYHHTQQQDIAVGTPIANRQQAELEQMIGFFINTLVLRTDLSEQPSFHDLLQRVRSVTLDAFGHRDVPFEMVVDALQAERNLSYSPLFQVLFTLQNASPVASVQQGDFRIKSLDEENTVAKFDLLLAMTEVEIEGQPVLNGNFEYNCDLFDASTIDRFAQRFLTLLEAIVAQPEQSIDTLSWFPTAERELVLHTWNNSHAASPQDLCIHQFFAAQAQRTPDQLALVVDGQVLTYKQLDQQANQLAHALRKQGVGPEVIVGLCLPRTLDLVVALLGILKAGGAYLPLDPNYPPELLRFQLQDAHARLLITNSSLANLWEDADATCFLMDKEKAALAQEPDDAPQFADQHTDQLAYVIYTSGSTGRPKGVCITHHNAQALISWGTSHFSTLDLHGVLAGTSICFDLSIFELFVPLSAGGTVYLVENSLQLPASPDREHITLINTVPSVMRELLRDNTLPDSLRVVNLAGEPLPSSLVQDLYTTTNIERIYNLYGPTEDTTYSTWELVKRAEGEVAIGRSLDHRQAYLLNERGAPVPVGVTGEIFLGGHGLTRGYLNRPELTAERYIPNPFGNTPGERLYRTGDLARWLPDGRLIYLGRNDHQVKIRGFRIELGEIEQHLSSYAGVQECAIIAQQDPRSESQSLVAYIVSKEEASLSIAEIRAFLQQRLPAHMIPSFFVLLAALPHISNGKIDRRTLSNTPIHLSQATQEMQLPRDPLEEAVAEIWRQVLDRKEIGIHENFFELGGHSLLSAQVISRIRTTLQVELPLRRLFETPTIAGLGEAIMQERQHAQNILRPAITAAPRDHSKEHSIPLSFAQQRLWILDRLDPGKTTYNMPFAWSISGALDREALEASLNEIVFRHSILRTTFPIKHDTPHQSIVHRENMTPVILPFTDLRDRPTQERPGMAERLLTEEANEAFDLAVGPLWRARLICIDETTYVFFLCMHHIISDGWSLRVIRHELATLYLAFSTGNASPLPPLTLQYYDYSIWQRRWLRGEVLEQQLSYWKKQLAGAPDQLALPTDRPRGAVQNFRGDSYTFNLAPDISAGLKTLGQSTGTTLFMMLFSAFQVLLNRYSNQDDIVVGTPIANRTHAEIEDIIGFFVNTLALRTDLSGDPSFLDVLQRVRQTILDAFAYQELPFEQVVEAIQPDRDLARSPLVQVMFTLQIDPSQNEEKIDLAPLNVSSLSIAQKTAKFDLTLSVSRHAQGFDAEFEYNTDLFDQTTIARMSEHFQTLLRGIIHDPTQPIARLPLLSAAEYQQIAYEWNATGREYPTDRLIFELIEEQARLHPEALALWDQGKILSYADLDRQANQLARVLLQQGVQPGNYVGIYAKRSLEMIVSLLAIFKAGAAYLPIDPSTPATRAAFMLNEAQIALLLTQEDKVAQLKTHNFPMLTLTQAWKEMEAVATEPLAVHITGRHPAYVIYTSGSTGTPKGVMVNHEALLNLTFWHQQAFELTAQDKATQLANLGFDAAVAEIWPYLAAGAQLYLVDEKTRLTPTLLVPWLVKQEITVSYMPTALVDMAVHLNWPAHTRLRLLLTGGDQLHRTPPENAPFTLINQYGPTENTVAASWTPVPAGSAENRLPVIGRPISNTQLYVLNRAGEIQPIGVPGELFIGGKSLAQGYLGRPDLTAERFIPDPFADKPDARLYQTGDLAHYLPDGTLEFLGRSDNQVKVRGFRIELGEIEMLLQSYPGVHEAIVVLNESLSGEKRLVAYIVPQEGTTLVKDKIRTYLKERLPEYMLPSSFSLLDELPQTAHGKVDRRALAHRRPISMATSEKQIAPRDAIELQLVQLWERLLGVNPIGVTDNFFQLGGHSLAGVRLMSQIQRLFHIDLPLSTLFEGATITHLANVLRTQEGQITSSSLVELQAMGNQPPLFCVHAAGGEVLCYMSLAHLLGTDQPIYGLQSLAVHARSEATPSIQEMATHYIDDLRTVQPEGPYRLCGWSMGGVIAFEMARQLEAQGQQVTFLGLIDSYLPSTTLDLNERALLLQFIGDLVGGADTALTQGFSEMPDLPAESQLEYLLSEVQRANILPPGVDVAYITRLFSTFKKNREAFSHYQVQPYAGPVTLFQASVLLQGEQVEITHGWQQFASQIDATLTLPGDHYTILRAPHVEVLARQILTSLKGAMIPST